MDKCKICGKTKPEHKDLNHLFSEDGQLRQVPTKKATPQVPLQAATYIQAQQRLLIRFQEKGLLDGDDINYILLGVDIRRSDSEGNRPPSGGDGH